MDKLKPIIEQKFWIFLGLALVLPFIGWYLAASDYAQGVEERETKIQGSFDAMNAISGNVPNEKWVSGADAIVQAEQKRFKAAQKQLWFSQKESMTWPTGVQRYMKDKPYEGPIDAKVREDYSQYYFRQMTDLEQRLRPFDYETGEGVLLFDPSSYTRVPDDTWTFHAPTNEEMWEAQIDYWLVRAVFDSIVAMNQGVDKITEAPVRELISLTLRGGDREFSPGTGGPGGEGGEGSPDMEMYSGMETSGPGGGDTGGTDAFKANVEFDLSEELGPAGNETGGEMTTNSMMMSGGSSEGGYGAGDGADAAPAGPGRYVDDEEGSPFRTRAFVLGVYMDHRLLPDFMAELSRSDWPIQIIRVQTRAVNLDQLPLAGRGGTGGYPGMTSGGMGPGMSSSMRGGSYGGSYSGDGGSEGYGPTGGFRSRPGMSSGRMSSSGGAFAPDGGAGYSSSSRPGIPGIMSGGTNPASRNAVGLVNQAMSDPYLAEVWIGGLITMFRPVEDEADADTENPQSADGSLGTDLVNEGAGLDDPTTTPQDDATPDAGTESTTPVPADGSATPGAEAEEAPGTTTPPATSPPGGAETEAPQAP